MEPHHDHPADGTCTPTCPGWANNALQRFYLQRRYGDMLAACRAAEAIEFMYVAPTAQGVVIPDYLQQEELVRLNLVVGRDTPEVLLDEWGVRCNLTFRGRRHECAFPWSAVMGGVLRAPPRRRPRFGVIDGAEAAARPPPQRDDPPADPGAEPRPTPVRFGVIRGGKL